MIDFESKEKSVRYAEGPHHPVGEEAHRTSVCNGHYDLPAWNDGYAALFPSLVASRAETRDALWQIFAVKECRSPVANRAQELPRTVVHPAGEGSRERIAWLRAHSENPATAHTH